MQLPDIHNRKLWLVVLGGAVLIGLYLRHRASTGADTTDTSGDVTDTSGGTADLPDIGSGSGVSDGAIPIDITLHYPKPTKGGGPGSKKSKKPPPNGKHGTPGLRAWDKSHPNANRTERLAEIKKLLANHQGNPAHLHGEEQNILDYFKNHRHHGKNDKTRTAGQNGGKQPIHTQGYSNHPIVNRQHRSRKKVR